ncbi:Ig-like domain-containing protein, partial [Staphylococcus equorum]|uniref:Ig-like domain-containing protein n=1 Tax=Staphylococcus equorum TaxID=246432 RepID=UPI0039804AD3
PEAPTVEELTSEDTQVSGTAEPNSEVTVTFPDGTTAMGTTDEEGNYTIDIPENVELEGGEEVKVVATDKDGNVSEEGTTTVTDITAPDAPTVEELTSEDTQVSGTAEPNSEVTVTFPDGTTATGTTDEEGNYTIDIPSNIDLEGGEEITATSKDNAGNISEEATTIVTDVTAPETPTVEEVTSEDTQVSGTAEPNSEVTVTFPDGTTVRGTTDEEGNYTIDIPENVELEGGEEVKVVATDKDGNVSEEGTTTVTDVTAPEAPTVEEVTSEDTQVSGTAEPNSEVTVTFPDGTTVTGTTDEEGNYTIDIPENVELEGGEEVTATSKDNAGNISEEGSTTVTDITAPDAPTVEEVTSEDTQVSGTAEPNSEVTVTFPDGTTATGTTDEEGNYTIDIPENVELEGGEEVKVVATDKDGNVSEEGTTTVTDVTAPEAPTVEEVTSEGTQVSGTAEPNSEVTVTFPDGTTATGTTDEEGNYIIDIPENVELEGGEEVKVVATDKDGNVSEEGTTTVTDVTAPEAPTVEEVTSEDTQVSGTAEPNSEVTVTFPDGTTATGTTDEEGNYTVDIPENVELEGGEEVKVVATDKDGNVSEEGTTTVTDITAPEAPTVNEVTSEGTQVTGTGEAGSTITVKFPDGSTVTGTVDKQGNYAIDLPIDKKLNGNEELVITSTDDSGNVSPETRLTVTDATAPNAPTVNEVTSEGTQVTGTGEAGSTITVKFPDGSVVTGTVDDQGNYAIDIPTNLDLVGKEELVVTSTDGAGNVSPETKVTVTDATVPNAPTVTEVTSEDTQVTGTGEAGSTITVKFPDGSVVTGTADNQGNYVIDLPVDKKLNGNEELVVTSTDDSGNVSPETKVTVKDVTVPVAPTMNEVTSEVTQVTGTGEAGSTITVKFPDGSVVTGVADVQGNYAIDLPIDKKLNGNEGLVVTSTDASGNVSPETKVTV